MLGKGLTLHYSNKYHINVRWHSQNRSLRHPRRNSFVLSWRHIFPGRTGAVLHLHAHRTRFCYFSDRNVHLPEHNEEKSTNAQEIHKGTNIIREMGLLWEDGVG